MADKTKLETAQRLVEEGDRKVAVLRAIIMELERQEIYFGIRMPSHDPTLKKLNKLEQALEDDRERLRLLLGKQASRSS